MATIAAAAGRVASSLDDFTGSLAFRMSFKVSLALVISCALAIYWGWSKPWWAGMSVLFPQERWPFLLGMSAIIGVATYLQAGHKFYGNIWFNLGFNIPIIALIAVEYGVAGPASFETAMIRFQETALGSVVVGIVALFVWPGRGDRDFLAAAQSVTRLQQELLRFCCRRLGVSGWRCDR